MNFLDLVKLNKQTALDEIKESNKTENIGDIPKKESRLLAAVIAENTRSKSWGDIAKQKKITERVKQLQGWN